MATLLRIAKAQFLSTPSARRATKGSGSSMRCGFYFYPRPPRGGRQGHTDGPAPPQGISIHALREEGDVYANDSIYSHHGISIHALREEGDAPLPSVPQNWSNFYPRPPRGGRPEAARLIGLGVAFLSTPSARRATIPLCLRCPAYLYFYPRPPRGGRPRAACSFMPAAVFLSTPSARRATGGVIGIVGKLLDFYPRPPRGGRLTGEHMTGTVPDISIHALREEGDFPPWWLAPPSRSFLSTPSARRATVSAFTTLGCSERFLSTPSARRAT